MNKATLHLSVCISLVSGALGTSLFAQTPIAPNPLATPAPLGSSTSSLLSPHLSMNDEKFFTDASEGIMIEQKYVELGTKSATDEMLKKSMDKMNGELSKVLDKLSTLATSKGAKLATEVSKTETSKIERLSKLKPDKFDKEFVKELVKETKKTAHVFEMAGKSAQDAEIKKFAAEWAPTTTGHDQDMEREDKELAKPPKK